MKKLIGGIYITVLGAGLWGSLLSGCSSNNPAGPVTVVISPTPSSGSQAGRDWYPENQTGATVFTPPRGFSGCVTFNNLMWVIAGIQAGGQAVSDVWSSPDGINWTSATSAAAFGDLSNFTALSFNGSMWVLGGYNAGVPSNDVWKTNTNTGASWGQLTVSSGGFGGKAWHSSVVFDNGTGSKMWVIGGGDPTLTLHSDAWSSPDGVTWTAATTQAAFPAREYHSSVVFNGRMWVIAGANSGGIPLNDVWSSSDGANWTAATTQAAFPARSAATVLVYNNLMWLVGGNDASNQGLNDVWYSADGAHWYPSVLSGAFSRRYGVGLLNYNNVMFLIGGDTEIGGVFNAFNDVWHSP